MIKLFIVLIILLGIIAIAQLMRVYELSAELRNTKEEDVSTGDNRMNGNLLIVFMVAFYAFFIWLLWNYGDGGLGVAASKHGVEIDWLLRINFYIIIAVFFLTNTLLFMFANKYAYNKDRKALFFSHNNKLELLWTVVPAFVLAVIIILGLKAWNNITAESSGDAVKVELYAKQFGFMARYAGENNQLGHTDFRMVSGTNAVGVQTTDLIKSRIEELATEKTGMQKKLDEAKNPTIPEHVLTFTAMKKLEKGIERMDRHIRKLEGLLAIQNEESDAQASDDAIATELHMVVNKEYEFTFRSQDVIHSAYFPHFRAQMNMVPGMTTRFKFIPTITTDSMRLITNNPKFDYILLCNKICGNSHYQMKMIVVVDKPDTFADWYKENTKPVTGVAEKTDSIPTTAMRIEE
jgi:cytochrome c oxidase subunit II